MIKIDSAYSVNTITTDTNYPAGKAKDATTSSAIDGTPIKASWFNDLIGSRQAIFKEAFGGFTTLSGVPDNVTNSDVLKALLKIFADKLADKTDTEIESVTSTNLPTSKAVVSYIQDHSDTTRTEILYCFLREQSWWTLELDEENNLFLKYDDSIELNPPTITLDYENNKLVLEYDYPYPIDVEYSTTTKKMTMTLN